MRHSRQTDEFLQVSCNELRSIVRDNPGFCMREFLVCPLEDDFYVSLCHTFPDLPVDDKTAATIQETAQVIKSAEDVDVGNVHMPVLVGLTRLDKARPLHGPLLIPALQQACL